MALSNEDLRELAKQYVTFARERAVLKLDAQLEVDGEKLRIQYEKKQLRDGGADEPLVEEGITIKRGSINHAKVVFAAPADWL